MNHQQITSRISDFRQTWKESINEDDKFNEFKNRCLNSFEKNLGPDFTKFENLDDEFCLIVGHHLENYTPYKINLRLSCRETFTYKFLFKQTNLRNLLFSIEAINMIESLNKNLKEIFIEEVINNLKITSIEVFIINNNEHLIFYPKGAKLLDDALIEDNLNWLVSYPKAYQLFANALKKIDNGNDDTRNILDDFRLSL